MAEFGDVVNEKKSDQLDPQQGWILVVSILVGILYDFLFYGKVAGASYPIFIFMLYALLHCKIGNSLVKKGRFAGFLMLVVLALSLTYLFFSNQVLRGINSILIPVLFVANILLITEKNRYDWFRLGFLKDTLKGILVFPFKHSLNIFYVILKMASFDNNRAQHLVMKKIMIGVIWSLPVLGVVIVLLASADMVFHSIVKQVFYNVSFADIFIHLLLTGVITVLAFSSFWGMTYNTKSRVQDQNTVPKLDAVSVLTGLCLLNIVYSVFCYIQFSYLFSSILNLLPEGFTHAEYARRGFFELIAVAIVNVAIILGSLNFTKLTGAHSSKAFKILNCGLIVSTLIMLLSSFFRMYLYEEVYGYTYLRVFTHLFMLMLFFLLVVTLYRVCLGKLNLAKWYIIIGLTSYVLVNYLNVDVFIAAKNMELYYKTGTIDINYLSDMSYDTTLYLKELTRSPNARLSSQAQAAIKNRENALVTEGKWQSYNLSKQRAVELLNR